MGLSDNSSDTDAPFEMGGHCFLAFRRRNSLNLEEGQW
jgi:hypothetical protein